MHSCEIQILKWLACFRIYRISDRTNYASTKQVIKATLFIGVRLSLLIVCVQYCMFACVSGLRHSPWYGIWPSIEVSGIKIHARVLLIVVILGLFSLISLHKQLFDDLLSQFCCRFIFFVQIGKRALGKYLKTTIVKCDSTHESQARWRPIDAPRIMRKMGWAPAISHNRWKATKILRDSGFFWGHGNYHYGRAGPFGVCMYYWGIIGFLYHAGLRSLLN